MSIRERCLQYIYLMRLNRPIGILLLLWPTLWALWLASDGHPNKKITCIFILGVIVMRSAGCVINDIADRHFDGSVSRTANRPLATGRLSVNSALLLTIFLLCLAFYLVTFCNFYTIKLAIIGGMLALIYPLLKRVTHLPQLGLGVAFTWGVPMAFAAQQGTITVSGWFLFLSGIIWPIIYDTMYAIIDREDDKKIGIKSAAILFNTMDRVVIGLLQILFIVMMFIIGLMFFLQSFYYIALVIVSLLFLYQQWLIRKRDSANCFRAFLNNNWVGLMIFLGIVLSYLQ